MKEILGTYLNKVKNNKEALWALAILALTLLVLCALCMQAQADWNVPFVPSPDSNDAVKEIDGAEQTLTSVVYLAQSFSTVVCLGLFLYSASLLQKEDYKKSLYTFIGAAFAGLASYLASSFLY